MVHSLESYAVGRWRWPGEEGVTVADANTGEPIVRVSSSGFDVGSMAEYAMKVGVPGDVVERLRDALLEPVPSS